MSAGDECGQVRCCWLCCTAGVVLLGPVVHGLLAEKLQDEVN